MGNLGTAYAESVERDVRGHLKELAYGALSLHGLQQWLMDNEALIEERATPELYDGVIRVEHIIAEYTGGHIDAATAVAEIAGQAKGQIGSLPDASQERVERAS